MKQFFIVWVGQLASVIGSSLTGFALGVWVYQQNNSATDYAMIQFFSQAVFFLVGPFAGVLVDRWNRRHTMMLADIGSGCCTLVMFLFISQDALTLPIIYLLVSLSSGFSSVQFIAYKAAVTQMVPKEQYGRAAGMVETAGGLAAIVTPVIAAFLMGFIGLKGIIFVDFATFLIALLTLLIIRIPMPEQSSAGEKAAGGFFKEAFFGWTYVRKHKALFVLLVYLMGVNFLVSSVVVLATPMILSFNSEKVLGTLLTICGFGSLFGGITLSVTGGPKNQVLGILVSQLICALAAILVGFDNSLWLIGISTFVFFFSSPFSVGCSQAIWQRKVPEDIQGRVFAIRQTIAFSAIPLAYGLSGPLADYVFEPMMAVDGALSSSVGAVIGTGPGRGIGLMYIIYGTIFALATMIISRNNSLRNLERDIPDADLSVTSESTETAEPMNRESPA